MGIKKNVFASTTERKHYNKLKHVWGEKYHLYHNLPFLNVFDISGLCDLQNCKPFALESLEVNQLKKTSVDFVLCDKSDKPLIAIDFDGMAEGFNVGTHYYPTYPANEWREHITTLKLKVAHGSFFPYFVVSTDFNDIAVGLSLTIVDGIIGTVLSCQAMESKIHEFDSNDFGIPRDQFDALPSDEREFYIEDFCVGIEVEAAMECNPIERERWRMHEELNKRGWKGGYSCRYSTIPEISLDTLTQERWRMFDNVMWIVSTVTLHTEDYGDIIGKAKVANYNTPFFSPHGLVESVAMLLAMKRYKCLATSLPIGE